MFKVIALMRNRKKAQWVYVCSSKPKKSSHDSKQVCTNLISLWLKWSNTEEPEAQEWKAMLFTGPNQRLHNTVSLWSQHQYWNLEYSYSSAVLIWNTLLNLNILDLLSMPLPPQEGKWCVYPPVSSYWSNTDPDIPPVQIWQWQAIKVPVWPTCLIMNWSLWAGT